MLDVMVPRTLERFSDTWTCIGLMDDCRATDSEGSGFAWVLGLFIGLSQQSLLLPDATSLPRPMTNCSATPHRRWIKRLSGLMSTPGGLVHNLYFLVRFITQRSRVFLSQSIIFFLNLGNSII